MLQPTTQYIAVMIAFTVRAQLHLCAGAEPGASDRSSERRAPLSLPVRQHRRHLTQTCEQVQIAVYR